MYVYIHTYIYVHICIYIYLYIYVYKDVAAAQVRAALGKAIDAEALALLGTPSVRALLRYPQIYYSP